jgi:Fe2+ or Zn2+ uptake regulation protein
MNKKSTLDVTAQLFVSHDLRCTRQRRALYTALAATKSHPTADQLYRDVLPRTEGMSLATVYNTLEAFCRAGLVQKLPSPEGSARFDACVANHLHLRDLDTGELSDVPEKFSHEFFKALPKELLTELQSKTGFEICQIQVEMRGRKKQAP